MNESSLKRLMRLAQKTGDVLIVTDPDGREPLVLMSVDRYEDMRLGENCCTDHDDADEMEDWDPEEGEEMGEDMDFEEMVRRARQEEQVPSINIEEEEESEEEEFASRIGPPPTEPEVNPLPQQKDGQDSQKNAGEEQFYLEPID